MKLNLGCGNDIRSGYINVDRVPQNQVPADVYRQGDIKSLDWLTEDGTIDEIVASDCLAYLPPNTVEQAIINWAQKLIIGGVLKIMTPDCYVVAKSFVQGQFDFDEYSVITFGSREQNDNRLSAMDVITLSKILTKAGLKITLKRYEGISIYVEAVR